MDSEVYVHLANFNSYKDYKDQARLCERPEKTSHASAPQGWLDEQQMICILYDWTGDCIGMHRMSLIMQDAVKADARLGSVFSAMLRYLV